MTPRVHRRVPFVLLLLFLCMLLSAWVVPAHSAPLGSITLAPATGVPPYVAKIVWNVTGVTDCTAYDGWVGAKATSGSLDVTVRGVTKFTLTCASSEGTAQVSWQPPTTNKDGTPLTDLAGFNVYRGTDPASFARVKSVGASVLSHLDAGLPPGTYYYAVSAVDSGSHESELSKSSARVISGGSLWTQSTTASVAVDSPPSPPANVVTAEIFAYEYLPATNSSAAGRGCSPWVRATSPRCFRPTRNGTSCRCAARTAETALPLVEAESGTARSGADRGRSA